MNATIGWALAALAVGVGWINYGWQGVVLAVTVATFWLVLQFSRSLRAMQRAGQAPVGHVGSCVMFNAKLRTGMNMMKVLGMTGSLGRRVGEDGDQDIWYWEDDTGSRVTLTFVDGRLATWALVRPQASEGAPQDGAVPPAGAP